jgi:hypothetical protein
MCDWRKLLRHVKSRPEIEIADKRSTFSIPNPSIEPSYKTGPKQVKMSISPIAKFFYFLKKFRLQHVALTVRRQKTSLFGMVYPNISIRKHFKTGSP